MSQERCVKCGDWPMRCRCNATGDEASPDHWCAACGTLRVTRVICPRCEGPSEAAVTEALAQSSIHPDQAGRLTMRRILEAAYRVDAAGDQYVRLAAEMFRVPESEVTPDMRDRAKRAGYAVHYGQTGAVTAPAGTPHAIWWVEETGDARFVWYHRNHPRYEGRWELRRYDLFGNARLVAEVFPAPAHVAGGVGYFFWTDNNRVWRPTVGWAKSACLAARLRMERRWSR